MKTEVFQPVVIPNLDLTQVTWAPSYCLAARNCGLTVTEKPTGDENKRIFIGDNIPTSLLASSLCSAYFLAAVDGTDEERGNIEKTDVCILPSRAEAQQIKSVFNGVDYNKLFVAGFPIDMNTIRRYLLQWSKKVDKSVCFLGETRDIKNPKLELEMVRLLKSSGYSCFHLSPTNVSISDELKAAGATVFIGIRGVQYYQTLARFKHLVCASFRESLFISGIEGVLLNIVPIVPNQNDSGFSDWCPAAYMYESGSADSALELIKETCGGLKEEIHLVGYSQTEYFNRVIERMKLCP